MSNSPSQQPGADFDLLSPEAIAMAVETSLGQGSDGTLVAYPSYVNRVYGLKLDDGRDFVAKFYRPGRWSRSAILDEHRFIADAAKAELPVVSPIPLRDGGSLGCMIVDDESASQSFFFALFPKMGGRNFDAEADDDWLRLGALLGRLHTAGDLSAAASRVVCDPLKLTLPLLQSLFDENLVPADLAQEFRELGEETLKALAPRFAGLKQRRIHGDCHRGNILDRPGDGLLVIDFDDMMNGPAVQDLWLLLPDHADHCLRELSLLVEGYEQFLPLDRRELGLIEGLRFMRMIYFLAWRSRQRHDAWFRSSFPDWGSEAFWKGELDDLRDQAEVALADKAFPPL